MLVPVGKPRAKGEKKPVAVVTQNPMGDKSMTVIFALNAAGNTLPPHYLFRTNLSATHTTLEAKAIKMRSDFLNGMQFYVVLKTNLVSRVTDSFCIRRERVYVWIDAKWDDHIAGLESLC
jgi:hypothetical protein